MYAVDSHICRNKKGTLNLYAPTTDQPFIGAIISDKFRRTIDK